MRRLAYQRRGRHTGAATLALLFGTAAAALVIARLFDLGVAATLVTVLVSGGAPAMLYLAWADYRDGHAGGERLALAGVADLLAVAVGAQWEAEAGVRRLNDPYPLSVSWTAADESLTDSWDALMRLASSGAGWPPRPPLGTWAIGPRLLAGQGSDLADVLARVPTGRLVVLGEPGAGKTMLMVRLVLDLLARRANGGPVPVLASLASWNPEDQDLHGWLTALLSVDYPALAAPAPPGAGEGSRVQALLDARLILPILDGLDEIPDAVRGSAITRINDTLLPGEKLVLTCRTEPYRSAVRPQQEQRVEATLRAAPAVQLRPLDADAISRYLREDAAGPRAAARWDPVLAVLGTQAPAAQALATPLMVGLARTIYNPRSGELLGNLPDPAELCNPDLADKESVEEHLFDAFIPAAYRQGPGTHPRWMAKDAELWLIFLAQHLKRRSTTDIEWWNLSSAIPRHLVGLLLGLTMGVVSAIGYPFPGGLGGGFTSGFLVGLAVRRWVKIGKDGVTRGLVGGLLGGSLAALIAVVVLGPGARDYRLGSFLTSGIAVGVGLASIGNFMAGIAGGLAGETATAFYEHAPAFQALRTEVGSGSHFLNGLGFGLVALFAVELAGRRIPARGLRRSPVWFACGVISAVALGFVVWIQVSWVAGLAVGLAATIAAGVFGSIGEAVETDLTKATNPGAVLRRDRATFLASCLGLGMGLGISIGLASAVSPDAAGRPNGIRFGFEIGFTNLVVLGLIFGFVQALYGSFTIASWWLAVSRRLPWRLMAFLDDAHVNRGILRQAGAVYQYRHIGLQRHLAGLPESKSTDKASPAA